MATSVERNTMWGFLVLRLFLAQFWFLQMIGKARDQESGITSIKNLGIWAKNTTAWMAKTTPLPEWSLAAFTTVLPFIEATLGVLLLVGLLTRPALIVSALLVVWLDVGLMLQLKHDVVAANTVILIATVMALQWSPANRFAVDQLLGRKEPAAP